MPLDLFRVAGQVAKMVDTLKRGGAERQARLVRALDTLSHPPDEDVLKRKIEASKTTWLVAAPVEKLDSRYAPPPCPGDFIVLATDGSHIDVDRHQAARCYLINTGSAVLRYGALPDAALDSVPVLASADADLVITPPGGSRGREQVIEGPLLGIKRSVEEMRRLSELAAGLPPAIPTLAMCDGTLILWGLEAYPDFVGDALLQQGFLAALEHLMNNRQLALASYISLPRGTDVVNALRVAICPHQPADCDRYCQAGSTPACEVVAGVRDRDLFSNILRPGERSALFLSRSSVVRKHYGRHSVYFFYLNVADEIARVEVPEWVARDETRLGLAHALVLDQCRRGQGYPAALSEAHEQAVITGADRDTFWQMVEAQCADEKLATQTSAKSRSKLTRSI